MRIPREQVMALFRSYITLTGVSSLDFEEAREDGLRGKKLGLVNGSSWITLWSTYFGNEILPGVKLVNIGNEAQQLNFMRAYRQGLPCPPQENITKTCAYARDLCQLYKPDAILLTCSTMNRALPQVQAAVAEYGVPVIQIDMPMMEKAVDIGGNILIVATHGPTVNSTRLLLEETARRLGKAQGLTYRGALVEEAFERLSRGELEAHNALIAHEIAKARQEERIDCVVLAQLSMSLFCMEHTDPQAEFGIPVLCSGVEGFMRIREIFKAQEQ